jgi:hypothetical protein
MIFTDISDELLDILTPYSDWFFSQDLEPLNKLSDENEKNDTKVDMEYCCGPEYLAKILQKDGAHVGYPEISRSFDLMGLKHLCPDNFRFKHEQMSSTLLEFLGARNEAVHVYYPVDGYMGWHNNWNASGYNILLSYTEKGGGFFKYRDAKTHEIVTMDDPGGWSCKVGYYGKGREPEKVYYHCAGTHEPRITLAYVIPQIDMWRNMIEDISGESADHLS